MTLQDFLKTLKTAKRPYPLLPSSSPPSSSFPIPISSISSHKLHSFLSDPKVPTSDCFVAFTSLLRTQTQTFKPDLHAHLTLVCRLIKSRSYSEAETLLTHVAFHHNYNYPFPDFVTWVENYCNQSRIITKLLNMLLKMYSDHGLFDMCFTVFDYMIETGVLRDERTCSVALLAMVHAGQVGLALGFLRRMATEVSDVEVSVYSLTIVVSGLCNDGELKLARELVEEMSVQPNIITFNTLVDGCVRRWDVVELDLVLSLMERKRIVFNETTFKLLIEGFSGSDEVERAEKLLFEMHQKGFEVESYLYCTVIRGHCRLGNISRGLLLLKEMRGRDISPIVDVYMCLIKGLYSVGEMSMVKELVHEMQNTGGQLDEVLLNVLANGHCKAQMADGLAEIQCMIEKKRYSSTIASSENLFDSNSENELVMDDESVPITLDNLK